MRRSRHASDIIGIASGRIPMVSLLHVLAVAEHLNFHHAANVLGTTQSSVSARIKALEETLGILLFERRHRGVRLTEAGRRFVAEVSTGIDHLDHAVRTAGAVSSGTTGQIDIGLICSIAGGCLAELRGRFRDAYPDVEQIVMEGTAAQTVALVRDGKLDVALVLEPVAVADCHSRRLRVEPFLIALPVTHPLAATDAVSWLALSVEHFLIRNAGAGPQFFEHMVRRIAEQNRSAHVRRCDVSRDTLMHMIANGEGITLASETARHTPWPCVVFRPIADETEQARFSTIWSPHNRSPALRNLLDLAVQMEKAAREQPEIHTS